MEIRYEKGPPRGGRWGGVGRHTTKPDLFQDWSQLGLSLVKSQSLVNPD